MSHPEVTQRYREARGIAQANKDGNADTEDLRQAVTSYRSLVVALLADDVMAVASTAQTASRTTRR